MSYEYDFRHYTRIVLLYSFVENIVPHYVHNIHVKECATRTRGREKVRRIDIQYVCDDIESTS